MRKIIQNFPQVTVFGSCFETAEVVVCSADHFFEKSGEYVFNPWKLKDAHAECQQKARQVHMLHPSFSASGSSRRYETACQWC